MTPLVPVWALVLTGLCCGTFGVLLGGVVVLEWLISHDARYKGER